jgi:hypothetical protein
MQTLIDWLADALAWFVDVLLYVPLVLYQGLLEALLAVLELLPVPEFVDDLAGYVAGISPGFTYFTEAFNFSAGLGIIFSAYVVRFVIRRLPVVG